jgi:hypothetical protein
MGRLSLLFESKATEITILYHPGKKSKISEHPPYTPPPSSLNPGLELNSFLIEL